MAKKTGIWTMNKNGNLLYDTEDKVLRHTYAPGSVFEHSAAGMITLAVCAAVDMVLFYQMFSKILYDSPVVLIISIVAMVVGFDYGPVYLGIQWKRLKQGYNVDKMLIYLLAAIFAIAFIANFAMRIAIRDMALPDLSADTTSIISGTVSKATKNPIAPVFSVFVAVLPLITSVVSFVVSNATYNPLLKEKRDLEEAKLMIDSDMTITESILREYYCDGDRLERMMADDDKHYECAVEMIYERAKMYGDYVRERIKEQMGEPAASNELSRSTCDEFLKRLDEVVDIYKAAAENRVARQKVEDSKTRE